ncbi:MAG: M20/M25/M40 family metallo-hydrolase [Anaerolineae bacterium]
MSELADSLNILLDRHREALTEFTGDLLRIPSVNGVDPESAIAARIAEQARRYGLDAQIVGADLQRPNVIVTVGEGEPGLILIGHLDTVAPGDRSRWSHDPFGGECAESRMYGRGAIDTKGGMAAALYALILLKEWGGLRGSVRFIGVPDEESGATGTLGIKWLHQQGLLRGTGAIYCYSGHDIILGHRGLYRCKITCYGESAHPGFPAWQNGEHGANAVTGMARLLIALEQIQTRYSTTPYFERFRTMITPGTVIQGGAAINIVPDRCESYVDARLTPETSAAQVRTWIDAEITRLQAERPKLKFSIETISDLPAAISDANAPLFRAVESALGQVTGEAPPRVVAGPANEGYLLIERGIPTVCGFGPIGANAHSADEYVEIDSLSDAALIYALTAVEMEALHE